jgi:hypothetical protein
MNEQTTMGAELELARIGTLATEPLNSWLNFHLHNDGSLRDATYVAGNIPVYPQEDADGRAILSAGMRAQSPYGLEIIINPYTYDELRTKAQKLAMYFGHVPQNPRTSIHIHVDISQEPWTYIRNVLLWVRALEAPLYRLACAGMEHRGCKRYQGEPNDHKFARPLSAPIGVNWDNGGISPLIMWNRITNAHTASEFVSAWGRLDTYWRGGFEHYMPHRLHCINLSSVLRNGTLEWRLFDGLYAYFDVLVDLVYNVHRLAATNQMPDFDFALGATPGVDADWMNNLLGMDVSMLWGEQWQKGCLRKSPLSHYPTQPTLHTFTERAVMQINNRRDMDTGRSDFPLFIRED